MGDTSATARTKRSPHSPVKTPSGATPSETSSIPLCEEASGYRGLEELCAQADTMRPIVDGPWGDIERSRTWLVKHLGLHALLPDTKHVPEDLKAKMAVRVNTQGV
jgi:hypothetical protein